MIKDFFKPIKEEITDNLIFLSSDSLGNNLFLHTDNNFPDLENITIAIIGVLEDRKSIDNFGSGDDLSIVRKELYKLFLGNWKITIADLGDIQKGNTVEDTYFAVSEVVSNLLKQKIIPVIIGGTQDITYANYQAYNQLEQTVNLVSVDNKFDLGNLDDELTSNSFLSKIIMRQPNNLFNYSNIGYQTFFNSQEEINLLNNLFFDIYRLGEVRKLELVEPIMRDADVVSIDLGAVKKSEAPANRNATINGFYGEEICAIARYAGISDKVTSFGVYEYNRSLDKENQTAQLLAQIIWYFIEGVDNRANDYPFCTKENYQKYTVVLDDDDPINFYKSDRSGRWWMEINLISDNKYKRHALIPCAYQDYKQALQQKIPERWYKAQQKLA